jgi:uncharacterized protein YbaP (TraB family)
VLQRTLLAVLAAVLLAIGSRAAAAPAMWLVKDADSEIYLFGTMHLLTPGTAWRTSAYDAAYQRAEAVWFEADGDADPAEVARLMATFGMDGERTLSQKLSPDALSTLRLMLKGGPTRLRDLDHVRPWAAAMLLQVRPMAFSALVLSAGADIQVTRQARADAKPIRTFETLEQQVRMFAALPEAVETQYLEDVIAGRGQGEATSLQRAWLAGDLASLEPLLVTPMKADRPALYDALLKRRNLAWADTIAGQMQGRGVQLVNVGALHLVGDDGLPALLAARGYAVTRIQ